MVNVNIEHKVWGSWPSIVLSTDAVELEVVGELGARVVSLRDKRREREWLAQGEPPAELEGRAWADEGVAFWGRESFGWDECLPTVSVCPDPLDPEGPPLRDHGDQWGRGAYLSVDHEGGAVEHTWSVPRWGYRMARRLSFRDERTVLAEYVVSNLADRPLPLLYSQHAVLALEPGSIIDLPEVHQVLRTVQLGIDLPETPGWPAAVTADGQELDLACVHTAAGWAVKLYAHAPQAIRAVAPDGARLDFDWDRDFAAALGIWLAYGAWPPKGEPREQVALEPTTSTHDDLASAIADGQERIVAPRDESRWWVELRPS